MVTCGNPMASNTSLTSVFNAIYQNHFKLWDGLLCSVKYFFFKYNTDKILFSSSNANLFLCLGCFNLIVLFKYYSQMHKYNTVFFLFFLILFEIGGNRGSLIKDAY